MPWLQLSLEITRDQADLVTEVFESTGALSVTLLDAANEPLLEPAPGEQPLWGRLRAVALFYPGCDAHAIRDGLRDALQAPEIELLTEHLDDRDWSTSWRDDFHSMRFGTHLWVCPSDESPPDPDAVVVQMDPGMAFGTGTHATTGLCLEWLDANASAGETVIDYGCGSGILAIAACKLGASRVYAVDIDPQALIATRDNAARNAVDQCIEVMLPAALDPGPVDVVIANILANPLIELSGILAGYLRVQGSIILTGILEDQGREVMAAYQQWFDFKAPVQRDEWVLLEGVKRAGGKE
jgi:ribosomal protein L11 methyltransferase